jgi:hypothetical protein
MAIDYIAIDLQYLSFGLNNSNVGNSDESPDLQINVLWNSGENWQCQIVELFLQWFKIGSFYQIENLTSTLSEIQHPYAVCFLSLLTPYMRIFVLNAAFQLLSSILFRQSNAFDSPCARARKLLLGAFDAPRACCIITKHADVEQIKSHTAHMHAL